MDSHIHNTDLAEGRNIRHKSTSMELWPSQLTGKLCCALIYQRYHHHSYEHAFHLAPQYSYGAGGASTTEEIHEGRLQWKYSTLGQKQVVRRCLH